MKIRNVSIKLLKNEELIKKAIEYNKLLSQHSVPETKRNTLISAILIALQDLEFVESFEKLKKNKDLVKELLRACNRVLEHNQVSDSHKKTILHEYSGIAHNQKLISETIKNKRSEAPNVTLKNLITDLKNSVLPFIKESDFDVLGRFYSEFTKSTGEDGKTGLVLTPSHITDFFCDLVELQSDDVVYDPCCGTGGFLVSAMKSMLNKARNTLNTWKEIKQNRLIGVEVRSDMFTQSCSNMMVRGSGKFNIYHGSCFDADILKQVKSYKATKGFLNPPYNVGSTGQLEFVEQTLECLSKGGQCVAICQMSVGIKQDKETIALRERLLNYHTLDAVFSMPDRLFYPKDVITSILVFTAHVPHPKDKQVFFGYLKDDGHVPKKYKGRIDDGSWRHKKERMLDLFFNKRHEPSLSITQSVKAQDEWCAEAYMETDYTALTTKDFINTIENYIAFKFLQGERGEFMSTIKNYMVFKFLTGEDREIN